ncbi:MAG: hypothetical protein VB118_12955 [Oscillospiraceae bacterium]|nr:hypothetical protein [Oscillospiraceae bacterium]
MKKVRFGVCCFKAAAFLIALSFAIPLFSSCEKGYLNFEGKTNPESTYTGANVDGDINFEKKMNTSLESLEALLVRENELHPNPENEKIRGLFNEDLSALCEAGASCDSEELLNNYKLTPEKLSGLINKLMNLSGAKGDSISAEYNSDEIADILLKLKEKKNFKKICAEVFGKLSYTKTTLFLNYIQKSDINEEQKKMFYGLFLDSVPESDCFVNETENVFTYNLPIESDGSFNTFLFRKDMNCIYDLGYHAQKAMYDFYGDCALVPLMSRHFAQYVMLRFFSGFWYKI